MLLNKILNKSLVALFIITSLICTIISSILLNAYSLDFYRQSYDKYALANYTGLNKDDYLLGMNTLLLYCQDKVDSIEVEVDLFDSTQNLFNQREIDHMVDVKNLAMNVLLINKICICLSIAALICLLFNSNNNQYLYFKQTSFASYSLIIGLVGGLMIFALADFNTFWTTFHHVFFTNDLWLLNPKTDAMIRMLPGELFNDLVKNILITFTISFSVIQIIVWSIIKHKKVKV